MTEAETITRFSPGDILNETKTDQLWIFRGYQPASVAAHSFPAMPERLQLSKPGETGYKCHLVEEFTPAAPRSKRSGYDLDLDIMPRVWAWTNWESVQEVEPLHGIECAMGCRYLPLEATGSWCQWPGGSGWGRYFLDRGQGGNLTGEALVILDANKTYQDDPVMSAKVVDAARALVAGQAAGRSQQSAGDLAAAVLALDATKKLWTGLPRVFRVAVCDHQVVDHSTPGGRVRGWHPATCAKCGLDLSVDSSD